MRLKIQQFIETYRIQVTACYNIIRILWPVRWTAVEPGNEYTGNRAFCKTWSKNVKQTLTLGVYSKSFI